MLPVLCILVPIKSLNSSGEISPKPLNRVISGLGLKEAQAKQVEVQNSALAADTELKKAQTEVAKEASTLTYAQAVGQGWQNRIYDETLKQAQNATENSALATERNRMVFDYMKQNPAAVFVDLLFCAS